MRIALTAIVALFSFIPTVSAAQSLGDLVGALGQNSRRPAPYQQPARYAPSPPLPNAERAMLSAAQRNFDRYQNLLPHKDCRVQDEFVGAFRRGMVAEMSDPTVDHPVAYFGVPLAQWTVQHVVEADYFMDSCGGQGQVRPGFFANDLWPAIVAARPEVEARRAALATDVREFNAKTERVSVSGAAERGLAATVDPQGVRQCLIGSVAVDLQGADTAEVLTVERVQVRTRDQYRDDHTRSSYRATGTITRNGDAARPFAKECSPLPGVGWVTSG